MDKQNLVLLPGLLCDAALWHHQSTYLTELANITIADFTRDDSITGMAEAALATAPERFALAGLSMGGYVAQEIMRRAPQRVTKLALFDTSARSEVEEQTRRRKELIEMSLQGNFKEVTPELLPKLIHPDRQGDKELTDAIIKMADHVGPDGFLRQQEAIIARPDGRDDLDRIQCPTMILCGRQDALAPVEVHEEMAARISNARFVIIEDCGHMTTMERPQAVTAFLRDWLLYSR